MLSKCVFWIWIRVSVVSGLTKQNFISAEIDSVTCRFQMSLFFLRICHIESYKVTIKIDWNIRFPDNNSNSFAPGELLDSGIWILVLDKNFGLTNYHGRRRVRIYIPKLPASRICWVLDRGSHRWRDFRKILSGAPKAPNRPKKILSINFWDEKIQWKPQNTGQHSKFEHYVQMPSRRDRWTYRWHVVEKMSNI